MATNQTKLAPTVLPDAEYNHRWSDEANYQLVRKSHDPRFGEIIIYKRRGTNDYIFAKEKLTTSKQAAAADIRELKSRVALNRPGLQRMLGYSTAVKKELCSTSYLTQGFYEFPKSDLAKEIGNRNLNGQGFSEAELSQIASQGLKGLNSLHQEKITHGDIRPQYIGFSHATGEVEILDRLADPAPIEKTQTSHLVNKKNLYLSPELYKRLQGKDKMAKFDPAKNDVYGLGLSILEAGNGQSVQDIYNANGTINQANLDRHLQNFNGKYRGGYLSNFVSGALASNEASRYDAGNLLAQLGSGQSNLGYATGGVAGGANAASNFGGHSLFDGAQGYPNLNQTSTTITNQTFTGSQAQVKAQALPTEVYSNQAPKEAYVSEANYANNQPSTNYSYSNASNYPSFVQQEQFSNNWAQKNRGVQGADAVPAQASQQQVAAPQPVAAAPAQVVAPAPVQAPVQPAQPAPATPSQANVAPAPQTPTTTTQSQQWVTQQQQPVTTVVYNTQAPSQTNVVPLTTTSQSFTIPATTPVTTSYSYTLPSTTTYTTPTSYTYTSAVQPTQYITNQPVQTIISTPSKSVIDSVPYLTSYNTQAPTVITNGPRYTSFADAKIRPLTPSLTTYYTTPQTIRPLTPQRLSNTYTTSYITSQPNIITYAQPTTITTTAPTLTFDSQSKSERVVPTTTITTGGLSGYYQPSTVFQPSGEIQTRKSVSFINYNDSKRDLTNVVSSAAFAKPSETTFSTQTFTPQVITTTATSPFTGSQRKTITFDEFQQIKRKDPQVQLVEAQPVGYSNTVVHEQPIDYSRVITTEGSKTNGNNATYTETQGYTYSGSQQIADLVRNAETKFASAQKVETHANAQPDEQAYVQEYTYAHEQPAHTTTYSYEQPTYQTTTTYTTEQPTYASQTWTQGGTTVYKYDDRPHVIETGRSSGYGRQSWTTSPEIVSTKGPRVSRRYRLENGQKIEITDDAYHKN